MDYAFLSKEGRGSQVVMEKAEGSGGQHVLEMQAIPMEPLIDSCMATKIKKMINLSIILDVRPCNAVSGF